ncbi:MAG: hypothetical protein ACE5EA_06085 [Nitrospirota bacterium]
MNKRRLTLFIILIIFIFSPLSSKSEDGNPVFESQDDSKLKLHETEIKGQLPDKPLQLKETEITGRIRFPKITSELPWREPKFLGKGGELDRSFLKEIYTPLDRDRFIWELRQRRDVTKR